MSLPWSCAWIIGASSGMGRELARLLDGRVAYVAVSARSEGALTNLARESRTIHAYPLDVTGPDDVATAARAIEATGGPIDLVVLSAGAWTLMDAADLDIDAVRRGVEVNYMGTIHGLAAVLPGMLARGRGHIAIMASVAGYRGLPRSIAYGPTKAALINLAETLRVELAGKGITVSLINPGFVDTPLTRTNPFPMPGLMTAEAAARRILRGLERRRFEIAFPFGFTMAMKALRTMPTVAYLWIMRRTVMRNAA